MYNEDGNEIQKHTHEHYTAFSPKMVVYSRVRLKWVYCGRFSHVKHLTIRI